MPEKPLRGFRIRPEVSSKFSKACKEDDRRASHVVEALMVKWLNELRSKKQLLKD